MNVDQTTIAYHDWRTNQVMQLGIRPGDIVELRIRNGISDDSPYVCAKRAADMFLRAVVIYPTAIVLHPAHLTAIRMRHQEVVAELRQHLATTCPITDIPHSPVPWEADEGLALDEAAARFQISDEEFLALATELIATLGEKESTST